MGSRMAGCVNSRHLLAPRSTLFIAAILVNGLLSLACQDAMMNPSQSKRTFPLYKESVRNQRAGLAFTWGYEEPYHQQFDDRPNRKGHYGNGQAYHDINGDGHQDILVTFHAEAGVGELLWYVNSGDNRRFARAVPQPFTGSTRGINAHKILKSDLNSDQIADFIALGVDESIPGDYTGNFTVLLGRADGRFDVREVPNPTRYWFHNGAAGDLDGDGHVDVITATFLWSGDGHGTFSRRTDFTLGEYSPLVYEIADLDRDGWNDIVIQGPFTGTTIIYNDRGSFTSANRTVVLPVATFQAVMDIEIIDIDGDGDLDLVELAQRGGNPPGDNDPMYFASRLTLFRNQAGTFRMEEEFFPDSRDGNLLNGSTDRYGWSVFKFDDLDGDGIDEIVAENYQDGTYNALARQSSRWVPVIVPMSP